MAKIRDIVQRNPEARFVNDVQISSFRTKDNLDLVNSYIFTVRSASGKQSSTDILKTIMESYLPGGVGENRFVVIATYGHGKSHFGLALANYFGMPYGSEEVNAVLRNIQHASEDASGTQIFDTFKKNHPKPYLIMMLRGDEVGSLRQKVFRELTTALESHPETANVRPPLWFEEAEGILEKTLTRQREATDAFLANHDMDLEILRERLGNREDELYDLFGELVQHVTGIYPQLNHQVSLRDTVLWLCDEFCGPGENLPFQGLLVLFDEFSTFVENYANQTSGGTPLQDLLNGIVECKHRAAFVALAQHDPDAVADHATRFVAGETRLESVKRELGRLPKPFRFVLYSSLEIVLDAYLKQDDQQWRRLLNNREVQDAIGEATDTAFQTFRTRYKSTLKWRQEDFQERVTRSCFPLHPMTTALLCDVEFQSTSNPRSVIGFVFSELDAIKDREAFEVEDGHMNWVLPIKLVDYFRDMLGGDWGKYESARRQIGSDQPELHHHILKAMLLQSTAEVPTQQAGGFAKVIAQMSGHDTSEVRQGLQRLHKEGYIRHDSHQNIYNFWPENQGAFLIERKLRELLEQHQTTTMEALYEINKVLEEDGILGTIEPTDVPWGHPTDWAAREQLLLRENLTARALRTQFERFQDSLDDRPRALILYLIARTPDDVEHFETEVPRAINNSFGPRQEPIIVFRPTQPDPEAYPNLLKYWLLRRQYSTQDILAVGQPLYEGEVDRYKVIVQEIIEGLKRSSVPVVPEVYEASIRSKRLINPAPILKELHIMAFRHNPGSFLTNQKLSSTNLRKAVWFLALPLANNTLGANQDSLRSQAMASDIVSKHLVAAWGTVASDLRIQHPEGRIVEDAWKVLDEYFAPGTTYYRAERVLKKLLERPFGFDTNTLTLLVSSWIGYHRFGLTLIHPEAQSFDELIERAGRPKDFIEALAKGKIQRRDAKALQEEIQTLIDASRTKSFSQAEAEEAIQKLKTFLADENANPDLKEPAKQTRNRLEADLETAQKYDRQVASMLTNTQAGSAHVIVRELGKIKKLPATGAVRMEKQAPGELRKEILNALRQKVASEVETLGTLRSLEDYQDRVNRLHTLKKDLKNSNLDHLVEEVSKATKQLIARRDELRAREKDEGIRQQLATATLKQGLIDLRTDKKIWTEHLETAHSEQVKANIIEHLKRTKLEIEKLEGLAKSVSDEVAGVSTTSEARALQLKLAERVGRYLNTDEHNHMQEARTQLKVLVTDFEKLDQLRSASVDSPEVIHTTEGELQKLRERISHPGLRKAVDTFSANLMDTLKKKKTAANTWLQERRWEVERGQTGERLLTILASPPSFLSPELHADLDELKDHVQKKIELDDVERVVSAFMKIKSPEIREECLRRLQELHGKV